MTYVRYIDKTRAYYLTQGYDKPYAWAHFDDIPFTPLSKPLSKSTIALVSTSEIAIRGEDGFAAHRSEAAELDRVYSIPSSTPTSQLYSRTHSFDSYETTLDDVNSYYPADRLQEALDAGRIGGLAARYHGVFNAYSQRRTRDVDAPEVLKRCREDMADIAILVPV